MPPHSPQMETQWALFLAGEGEAAHAAVAEGGGLKAMLARAESEAEASGGG